MDGTIVKVLISTPCGPVLIQREDGSVIVLDAETASNTLVLITEKKLNLLDMDIGIGGGGDGSINAVIITYIEQTL